MIKQIKKRKKKNVMTLTIMDISSTVILTTMIAGPRGRPSSSAQWRDSCRDQHNQYSIRENDIDS